MKKFTSSSVTLVLSTGPNRTSIIKSQFKWLWKTKSNILTPIQNILIYPKEFSALSPWQTSFLNCLLTPLEDPFLTYWNRLKINWMSLEKSLMLWVLLHQLLSDKNQTFWWLWFLTSPMTTKTLCQESTLPILRSRLLLSKSEREQLLKENSELFSKISLETSIALMTTKMIILRCQLSPIKETRFLVFHQWNASDPYWFPN